MITSVRTLVYADDAEAAREFFRDVLDWPHVDVHDGWLIFKTGPSELAVHPTSGAHGGQSWKVEQHHEIALMCDDIERTVDELTAKGAEFTGGTQQRPFGTATMLKVPGAGEIMLYQPSHAVAHSL